MAIVWKRKIKGTHYEVRSAGQSVRLYTDGVFHSQYNPKHILTGGVWDLLLLPAFFYPSHAIKRVLVLGVGGGAVIHQLYHFCKPDEIVAVEFNAQHIRLAKRYFKLQYPGLALHCAEALFWLKQYQGEPFDMIIEDLFLEKEGEPARAIALNPDWLELLTKHLSEEGVLVMNCVEKSEIRCLRQLGQESTQANFKRGYCLETSNYGNYVVAFTRKRVSLSLLKKNLQKTSLLDTRKSSCRLDYTAKAISYF